MELSEKEQKTYNTKLNNLYYYSNVFNNEDNSKNNINSLEKRETFNKYFFDKISFLKKEILFYKNAIKEIKEELLKRFASFSLSEEEINLLSEDIISVIPIYDENLNKTQNEIVFEALSSFLDDGLYKKLQISDKDAYLEGIKKIKEFERKILKYEFSIELLEEELLKVKPIEIKNGFYLFENLNDHLLLSNIFEEKEGINSYNSIFIGKETNNKNSVYNIVPELTYDPNLEQKTFIATNGKGGRYGGLFKKEIIASCKEEALLKLNKWAEENNEYSWSIYRMTMSCSMGFINIYEKKDQAIK